MPDRTRMAVAMVYMTIIAMRLLVSMAHDIRHRAIWIGRFDTRM
jgi:hypothetical protein